MSAQPLTGDTNAVESPDQSAHKARMDNAMISTGAVLPVAMAPSIPPGHIVD